MGVGIMVIKDGQVLLGQRKGGSHDGLYAFPGGQLEWFETFVDCAERELAEECGKEFVASLPRFFCVHNIVDEKRDKHYLSIVMVANWQSGEPQNMEPEKCSGWKWFPVDQLPDNIFESNKKSITDWAVLDRDHHRV